MARIPVNVQRGADLLDERLPGWAEEINPRKLDLSNKCNCTLGQLFGDYDRGVALLGLGSPSRYGFHLAGRQTFDRLRQGWRDLLAERAA